MAYTIHVGDALAELRKMPPNSVDCCVTSPPYWALRDYGVEGQIGFEPTPSEWVTTLVAIFREVRRVLATHGTCWINVGDKYASDGGSGHQGNANSCRAHRTHTQGNLATAPPSAFGLKPKDLCLLPARLAIALQDDGWYVRQWCIWHKPSPMPESTRDRPTTDYEPVLMLSKSEQYFYDGFAVMEETTQSTRNRRSVWRIPSTPYADEKCLACGTYYDAREKKALSRTDKWELICGRCGAHDRWLGHFATFPQGLAEICIKAGTSESGNCGWCGKPIERIIERTRSGDWSPDPALKHKPGAVSRNRFKTTQNDRKRQLGVHTRAAREQLKNEGAGSIDNPFVGPVHRGWRDCPTCALAGGVTRPPIVLDPFGGAMTTALVAERLGRDAIMIELNPEYVAMGEERLRRAKQRVEEERLLKSG